ncbi:MAG: metallophosphoesterase [Lentisphaeria bacterium]|nr:metallophosphoesterase [Lentisphaeria bacterium]
MKSLSGLFDKRLLGTANHILRRHRTHHWERVAKAVDRIQYLNPDLVVCTGDFTTLSEDQEFDQALDALAPLINNSSFEFLFVPGNHDHYVKSAKITKKLSDSCYTLSRERWKLNDYPQMIQYKGVNFLLFNQARPAPFYASYGELDPDMKNWMGRTVKDEKFILINHYPLYDANGISLSWRRRCINNEFLQTAFNDAQIPIAFCGHIHHEYSRTGPNNHLEICSGSLTHTGIMSLVDYLPEENTIRHEWIDIDTNKNSALGVETLKNINVGNSTD